MLRKFFPESIKVRFRTLKQSLKIFLGFCYNYKLYVKNTTNKFSKKEHYESMIIMIYHVIEKGLTMPKSRLGFGQDRVNQLIDLCHLFINKFGVENLQLKEACMLLNTYHQFHLENNYNLDEKLVGRIRDLLERTPNDYRAVIKYSRYTNNNYFKFSKDKFDLFSKSRKSVRSFSEEDVTIDEILDAIDLAKNAPSACNRQPNRVIIIEDKEIMNQALQIQGGNRGFGHLANKLLIVCSDNSYYFNQNERNQAYIDGGIFCMNLLYSIHFKEIACCVLNCSLDIKSDRELRDLINIKDSEVFIAMVACGMPSNDFSTPVSLRRELSEIVIKK